MEKNGRKRERIVEKKSAARSLDHTALKNVLFCFLLLFFLSKTSFFLSVFVGYFINSDNNRFYPNIMSLSVDKKLNTQSVSKLHKRQKAEEKSHFLPSKQTQIWKRHVRGYDVILNETALRFRLVLCYIFFNLIYFGTNGSSNRHTQTQERIRLICFAPMRMNCLLYFAYVRKNE